MNTIDFVKDQLVSLFPDIDLTNGSPVDRDLIQPLRARLGDELLGISAGEIIRSRLASEYPELTGIQTEDLLVKPADLILEPLRQIIGRIDAQTSTNDLLSLTDDELDAVVGTLFIYRTVGVYAEYQMRLYVRNPRPIVLGPDNICRTSTGLSFYPSRIYTFHVPDILSNREGNLYYVEFNAIASSRGERYNVSANEISIITGVTDAVRVRNIRRITGGTDTETNEELLARVSTMLGERSLVSDSGIVAKINSLSNGVLRRTSVVGRGEVDMLRDVLSADITITDDLFGYPYAGSASGSCPEWVSSNGITYTGYSDTLLVSIPGTFDDTVVGDELSVMDSGGNFGHGTVRNVISSVELEVTALDEVIASTGTTVEVDTPITAADIRIQDTFHDVSGVTLESLATAGYAILADGHDSPKTVSGAEGEYAYVGSQRIIVLQACDEAASRALRITSFLMLIGVDVATNVQIGDFITFERWFGEHSLHRITRLPGAGQIGIEPDLTLWNPTIADTKWTIHRNGAVGWDTGTQRIAEYFDEYEKAPGSLSDYVLVSVDTPLPSGSPVSWTLHHASTESIVATLTINDMPGGKLITDEAPYVPGEVHVGGCADAYVVDNSRTGYSLALSEIVGIDLVVDSTNINCTTGSPDWTSPVNFISADVKAGDVLVIPDTYGAVTGSYIISKVTSAGLVTTTNAPDTASNMDYQIVRNIHTPLDRPRNLIDYGNDLTLSVFTTVVTFGHNILAQGAETGHVLHVTLEESEPFDLTLVSINPSGLTASVSAVPSVNITEAGYEIWDTYGPAGAVARPIVEVTDVTMESYTIPYAKPVLSLLVSMSRYGQKAPTEVKRTPYVSIVGGSTTMNFLHNHPAFYDVEENDFILVNSIQFQVASVHETAWQVTVTEDAVDSIGFSAAVIAPPQIGTMRVYFKDPTEGWIDPDTLFPLRTNSSYTMSPDERAYRLVVSSDEGIIDTVDDGYFDPNDDNFNLYRWDVGDYLVVEAKAIIGDGLPGPTVSVNGKYLTFTVDGVIKTVAFAGTDPINLTGYLGFGGVVQQINAANIGVTATVEETGGSWYLVISSPQQVTLVGNVSAAIDLGFVASSYTNVSLNAGTYVISGSYSASVLHLVHEDDSAITWLTDETRLSYKVYRKYAMDINMADMRDNTNELGLYYTDVPVSANFIGLTKPVSVFDEFDCEGETAFGYWFTTDKESLIGSVHEEVSLHVTATFPDIDGEGGLAKQIAAAGESIVLKFEGSSAVVSTQASMLRDSNRNVLSSTFLMHKYPAHIRMFFSYTGGSSSSIIRNDLNKLLTTSDFLGRVTAYEVGKMLVQRHTIDGVEPITMLKLAWDRSRTWSATISQDRLVFGSLEYPKLDWTNSAVTGGTVLTGALAGYGGATSHS